MNLIKNFAENEGGSYEEESVKNVFSQIGRLIYQPKKALFKIGNSQFSINLDEVGGAIPTAEPFRITLHLDKNFQNTLEIYPSSFVEKILQKMLSAKKKLRNNYTFIGNASIIEQLIKNKLLLTRLQKNRVYIRIPKENTSKIILTPPYGIKDEMQLADFIEILKCIETTLKTKYGS
ncbi:hypothetical protein [Aequorivita marisscotiae]|uniref:Uncharacterized protein n=1 Tax=Aequorivita marisscotiae TaxID=3040348 RepID=A0ABY8KY79_9FLAO|nr:hypothetical protein [Aequorivita sp. Ant34-E75]WGF92667.1 hypothetical protein QCQ61_00405 [Aequorivita sp. Ant34-E75]